MSIIKILTTNVKNPRGIEISTMVFNLLINKEVNVDENNETFLPQTTIYYRYHSLAVITNGLLVYSIISGMVLLLLSAFSSGANIHILTNIILTVMGLTSINTISIAIYLCCKIFSGQIKYNALIKEGLGENIVGEKSHNLYNRDYFIALFAVGLPIAILFILVVFVW